MLTDRWETGAGCRVKQLVGKICPSSRFAIRHKEGGEGGAFIADLFNFLYILEIGNDHPELSLVDPVLDITRGEHRRARCKGGPQLDQGDGKDPPFRDPGEHVQYLVSLADPVFQQDIDGLVGKVGQVQVTVFLLFAILVNPEDGEFITISFRPGIDYIKAEIIEFWNYD